LTLPSHLLIVLSLSVAQTLATKQILIVGPGVGEVSNFTQEVIQHTGITPFIFREQKQGREFMEAIAVSHTDLFPLLIYFFRDLESP
jgi:hypothetical protein